MSLHRRRCACCIVPPYILQRLLENKDKNIAESALQTLLATAQMRGEREIMRGIGLAAANSNGRRTVYDLQNRTTPSSAVLLRSEDGPTATDDTANRAFDGLGTTREFYKDIFDRNSVDGRGLRLDAFVHYGFHYNNAFWNGQYMVFGDGDGLIFTDFTKSIDVIAHELTHGVTEYTANLAYHNQSGALNESISDVFGSLVKQWSRGQAADEADWLIGEEVFTPGIAADALRSMKAPGTAFNNNLFGKDDQPDHMSKFVHSPDTLEGDWGGVHTNSGIPNKAFFLAATEIGGHAWEAPGHIWYESLLASNETTDFQEFAETTYLKADQLYGTGSAEQKAVQAAWKEVGIAVGGAASATRGRARARGGAPAHERANGDTLAALAKQVEALATQVKALSKDIGSLKVKK